MIVNPAAGAGAWRKIEPLVRDHFDCVGIWLTNGPGHAASLAEELAGADIERLIVGGGDGTFHEAANGLLESGAAARVVLGLLPLGTGSDLARSLGIPNRRTAIERVQHGRVRTIDAAHIEFQDHGGMARRRWFINVASAGLGGEVAARVRRCGRRVPGAPLYLAHAVRVLGSMPPARLSVAVDGAEAFDGPAIHVAAANGRFQGGGIQIAPQAALDDGALDVTIIQPVGMADLALNLRRLYNGQLLSHPKVLHFRGQAVKLACPEYALVEVDGEPLGSLPAEVKAVPGALRVLA